MNRKITIALVAVGCLAVAGSLVAQAGGDASSKVQQLEQEMRQAQKNSDVPAGGQIRKRIRQATNTIIDKA